MNHVKASVGACTPSAMAAAGVPLDEALVFQRLRSWGPRTRAQFAIFNGVRATVGAFRAASP